MMRLPSGLRPAAAGVVLFLALSGCGEEQAPAPNAIPVTVSTLSSEPVSLTRELPGRVTPYLGAEVRPQVSGIVKERLFTEGAMVNAGDPLYQLDDATYQADLNSAEAQLARAAASLKAAQATASRTAKLVEMDAVSKQAYDDTQAALRQAQADVALGRATVASRAVTLGYARISAPISGRIGRSSVTAGALVTANQAEPLAVIQQLNPIYVDLNQSSAELLELRKGVASGTLASNSELPVTIILEDGSKFSHEGKLAFSEVTVDPTTGSFSLRVMVDNPDGILLPGMYVRAVIGTGLRQNGLLVPQQGIARDPKGNASAMIVGKDNKVELRTVKVSRTIGNKWLVDSGLAPNDKVIVEGLQKVRPGALVEPSEAKAEESKTEQPAPAASGKR